MLSVLLFNIYNSFRMGSVLNLIINNDCMNVSNKHAEIS